MANSMVSNVLAIISVDDVLEKHGTNNSVDAPVTLGTDCVGVFSANVTNYLDPLPQASVSSTTAIKWILWRAASLTFNEKYHCLITGVSVDEAAGSLVSQPSEIWIEPSVPMVKWAGTTVEPDVGAQTEWVWASEVKAAGAIQYNMSVKVIDHHGELQGCYLLGSTVAVR